MPLPESEEGADYVGCVGDVYPIAGVAIATSELGQSGSRYADLAVVGDRQESLVLGSDQIEDRNPPTSVDPVGESHVVAIATLSVVRIAEVDASELQRDLGRR